MPYEGYLRRDMPTPDPELTQVGPRTPAGEYLRRFWQPVAFARDLASSPRRVRIMGEDLVVFRDRSGRIGLLHLHCAHRGTSLEFGIPVDHGIRCCYHGRLFAPNFNVRFIKLRAPEIRRRYYIYQRRGLALSPPAEAFVKLLRSAARSDD